MAPCRFSHKGLFVGIQPGSEMLKTKKTANGVAVNACMDRFVF